MNNKMREILTKISPIEIYDCNREVSNSRQIFFIKNFVSEENDSRIGGAQNCNFVSTE